MTSVAQPLVTTDAKAKGSSTRERITSICRALEADEAGIRSGWSARIKGASNEGTVAELRRRSDNEVEKASATRAKEIYEVVSKDTSDTGSSIKLLLVSMLKAPMSTNSFEMDLLNDAKLVTTLPAIPLYADDYVDEKDRVEYVLTGTGEKVARLLLGNVLDLKREN
jgi:hypothetical protein